MQQDKVRIEKKKFRIGELAKELNIKKFVIRFWEKEFDLKAYRSQGGQRFYTNEDLITFTTIKTLLYDQGYTIPGAKSQLASILHKKKTVPARKIAGEELEYLVQPCTLIHLDEEQHMALQKKMGALKERLITLKNKL